MNNMNNRTKENIDNFLDVIKTASTTTCEKNQYLGIYLHKEFDRQINFSAYGQSIKIQPVPQSVFVSIKNAYKKI